MSTVSAKEGRHLNVLACDLKRQFDQYAPELEAKALQVLRGGWYVLGPEVEAFETEFARYVGAKHCVGLASGLDALWIAFRLLGVAAGDEVIVSANAYIACVMGITMNGATPVFVEPDAYGNLDAGRIEQAVTPRCKAILAVHLYGQTCDMPTVMAIAERHGLTVVEDCAQSHGSTFLGRQAGTFGRVSCFSFYPTKGVGAFGDAGAIVTDDAELAERFRMYRNYGSRVRYHNETEGANSRLDELQAGLLRIKLRHLDEMNAQRQTLAARYTQGIQNPQIVLPLVRAEAYSTWHQYVVRCAARDRLAAYLRENGVGTGIHYPIPPHLSEAYAGLGHRKGDFPLAERAAQEVLSLPMFNGLRADEQAYVIELLNAFKG